MNRALTVGATRSNCQPSLVSLLLAVLLISASAVSCHSSLNVNLAEKKNIPATSPENATGAPREQKIEFKHASVTNEPTLAFSVPADGFPEIQYFTAKNIEDCIPRPEQWQLNGGEFSLPLEQEGSLVICVLGKTPAGEAVILVKKSILIDRTPPDLNLQIQPETITDELSVLLRVVPNDDLKSFTAYLISAGSCPESFPASNVWIDPDQAITLDLPAPSGVAVACVYGKDQAGNLARSSKLLQISRTPAPLASPSPSSTPAATAPAAPTALTLSNPTQTSLELRWTDNAVDETGFVVERSADGISGWSVIVTTGANVSSFTDSGLTAGTTYYYRVKATNSVGSSTHISASGATNAAVAVPPTAGFDFTDGYVAGPRRMIALKWTLVSGLTSPTPPATFKVYSAATEAGIDLSGAADQVITGSLRSSAFQYGGGGSSYYFVLVAIYPDGTKIRSNNVKSISFVAGSNIKLLSRSLTSFGDNIDPSSPPMTSDTHAIHVDSWGNVLMTMTYGFLRVLCNENIGAPYCIGKTVAQIHTIIGNGAYQGERDLADNRPITDAALGRINAITSDNSGNLFLSDQRFNRIRAVCFDVAAAGFCNGRIAGRAYVLAGNGLPGTPVSGNSALLTQVSNPNDLALDAQGNLVVSLAANYVIGIICQDVSAGSSACSGRTSGNFYVVAGNGTAGDGADNSIALASALGTIGGLKLTSNGNIFFTDSTYYRIRGLCLNTLGYCAAKTAGNSYRIAGSGVIGDTANAGAATLAMGRPQGIDIDASSNIYFSDTSYRRIRVVCLNTSSGFCSGLTAGSSYRLIGSGSGADAIEGAAFTDAHGTAFKFRLTTNENLIFGDETYYRVRLGCRVNAGLCAGKTLNQTYRITMNAGSPATPAAVDGTLAGDAKTSTARALSTDSANNYYYFDNSNYTLMVLCNENVATTICRNRAVGMVYRVAGDGTNIDGANDVVAATTSIGELRATLIDQDNNILLADYWFHRVRLVCVNLVGRCSGKTAGNLYNVAGTGVAGTSDNVPADSNPISRSAGLVLDKQNNLYVVAYNTNMYIWVICTNTVPGGFCNGKIPGNIYTYAGGSPSGTPVDGTDRLSVHLGRTLSLSIDAYDNVYWMTNNGENPMDSIHVVCHTVTLGGYCSGKTLGAVYRYAGNATAGNGLGNVLASTDPMGFPLNLMFDSLGNGLIGDSTYLRFRIVCANVTGGGFCQGKNMWFSYPVMGTGVAGNPDSGNILSSDSAVPSFANTNGITLERDGNLLIGDSLHRTLQLFQWTP